MVIFTARQNLANLNEIKAKLIVKFTNLAGISYIIICLCKSRVMLRFVRQGKIPFVPIFIFEEIVMKVSTTKKLICED